jgi:hypothetical protein
MAGYGRKKTFKEKMTDLKGKARRAFILTALGGAAIGGPLYYHYGTIHEQEVKIKDVKKDWVRYEEGKGSIYDYKIVTDRGMVLDNHNTLMHGKFNSEDIQNMLSEGRSSYAPWGETAQEKKEREANSPANKVYKIRYYGAKIDVPFIHTTPNLLSVREITPEELQARAEQRAAAEQARQEALGQKGQQQPNGQQQPANGTVTPAPANNNGAATGLSGTMITFETVAGGQKIQMTVPIEAADKITINKVTPLVPTQQPKPPGN